MSLEDKKKVWKQYKENLPNEENEWSGKLNAEKNEGPCEKLSIKTVTQAINLIKTTKAAELSGI